MKKLRQWLINTFLPTWVRERVEKEISRLRAENEQLRQKNKLLNAYIDGMENVLRHQKKTVINTTGEVTK